MDKWEFTLYALMLVPIFLQYIIIFYDILVFLRYVGLPVYFLFNTNTGTTKIPSFQFYTGISPSSD